MLHYYMGPVSYTHLDVYKRQPEYLAEPGTNCNFILKHSVGNNPGKAEVDVPLTYADYY